MLFFKSLNLFKAFLRVTKASRRFINMSALLFLNTFNHNKCAHILDFILHTKIKGAAVAVIVW